MSPSPLCPLDADSAEHAIRLAFLPDGISGIDIGVQPLIVHVPQYPDRLLAFSLALQYCILGDQCLLSPLLDFK